MAKLSIQLTLEQTTGTAEPFLVAVAEDVEWNEGPDGKRRPGNRIGTRYTVLMLSSECAPLIVRTPEAAPVVSAEEVAAACLAGQFIKVRFQNFAARPYQGKNGLGVSATADSCEIVNRSVASGSK